MKRRETALRVTGVVLLAAAASTLGLAVWSLFAEYGLPDDQPAEANDRGTLAGESLERRDGESAPAYFERLSLVAHDRMRPARSEPVPVSENYVIFAAAQVASLTGDGFDSDYEFRSPEKALDRGYGACSQYATVVYELLRREGFSPRRVAWPQHTVVEVEHDGQTYILDPYFGTSLRRSVSDLRADPSLVEAHYGDLDPQRRFTSAAWSPDELVEYANAFYSTEPQTVQASGTIYGARERLEKAAYPAKWALPAFFGVLGMVSVAGARRTRRRSAG